MIKPFDTLDHQIIKALHKDSRKAASEIARDLNANERTMIRAATRFHEGGLDSRSWLSAQKLMLKREYLQNAALGAGGWDRLTARDYGRIGGHLSAEYGRLASMAEQIAAGEVTLPQALNRITMYQGGARRMYQIDCAAEKSAMLGSAPSRNGRPSSSRWPR